jgi:hypothetical protein
VERRYGTFSGWVTETLGVIPFIVSRSAIRGTCRSACFEQCKSRRFVGGSNRYGVVWPRSVPSAIRISSFHYKRSSGENQCAFQVLRKAVGSGGRALQSIRIGVYRSAVYHTHQSDSR